MGIDAHTIGVKNCRTFARFYIVEHFLHSAPGIEHVGAVHVDDLYRLESDKILSDIFIGRLFFIRNGNSILIILNHKNDRQLFPCRTADRFIDKPFRNGRLAEARKCDFVAAIFLNRACNTDGVQ